MHANLHNPGYAGSGATLYGEGRRVRVLLSGVLRAVGHVPGREGRPGSLVPCEPAGPGRRRGGLAGAGAGGEWWGVVIAACTWCELARCT